MTTTGRARTARERGDRAEHILDVAVELVLRFGYRRVTIDDIAHQAGIGKGTIYLHWRTRDDLFQAVFEREMVAAIEELIEVLHRDSDMWRPRNFVRGYFLAIMNRPLLRAVALADTEILGALAGPDRGAATDRHQVISRAYISHLAERGVLRDDLDIDELSYALLATLEGFLTAGGADHPHLDLQARAELLALTVAGAFETPVPLTSSAQSAISRYVIGLLTELVAAGRADLDLEPPQAPAHLAR